MTICDLKRGDRAVVLKAELPHEMRQKLASLRIYTGMPLTVLKVSFRKRTYLVETRGGKVALGREIAAGVRVWRT